MEDVNKTADNDADQCIECIGLYCPEPLFRTRQAMDALEPGQVLEVEADDPAAESDLTCFAKRAGHEVIASEWSEGTLKMKIKKGAPPE